MRIKSLTLRGLKGQDTRYDWLNQSRIVLSGPNGAGKTAALQAIEYVVRGYVGALGPRGTSDLASGDEMHASIRIGGDGDDFAVARTWRRNGSPKESICVTPDQGLRTKTQQQEWIDSTLGSAVGPIDVGKLVEGSSRERAKYLLGLLGGGHDRKPGAVAERLLGGAEGEAAEKLANAIVAVFESNPGRSMVENLEAATEVIKRVESSYRADLRSSEGHARKLAEGRAETDSTPGTVTTLQAEIEEIQGQRRELEATLSEARAAARAHREALGRRGRAQARVTGLHDDIAAAERLVTGTEKLLTQARERLKEAEGAEVPGVSEYREDLQQLDDALCSVICWAQMEHPDEPFIATMDAKSEDCRAKIRSIDEARDTSARVADRRQGVKNAALELERATARLADLNEDLEQAQGALREAHEAQVEALQAIDEGQIEAQIKSLAAREDAAHQAIRAKERSKGLELARIEAQSAITEARDRLRLATAAKEQAIALAGELVNEAMQPLLLAVNGLVRQVADPWRLVVKAADGGIEFGAIIDRDAAAVPLTVLSGGERAIFQAALAVSLVRLQDPPLRLLMIEAGELDQSRLEAFLLALGGMAEDFGTIVVATHVPVREDETWTVCELSGKEPASTESATPVGAEGRR